MNSLALQLAGGRVDCRPGASHKRQGDSCARVHRHHRGPSGWRDRRHCHGDTGMGGGTTTRQRGDCAALRIRHGSRDRGTCPRSAGHALDFDDIHPAMLGHPSGVLIPVILTLAPWPGSTATARSRVRAGAEVAAHLGRASAALQYSADGIRRRPSAYWQRRPQRRASSIWTRRRPRMRWGWPLRPPPACARISAPTPSRCTRAGGFPRSERRLMARAGLQAAPDALDGPRATWRASRGPRRGIESRSRLGQALGIG